MDLRPISVTSAVYRLWAATRLRMLMEWMLAWVPEGMRGAIPKRGADDVMYAIGLRIEHAAECGKPLFGLSVDFMKCFDRLPHEIMFRLMEVMGLDPGVLRAMKAVYGSMQRHFKTARAVGEPFVATNGILQGCPLSVLFLNALIAVWVRAVGALTTPAQAMAYLDDIHAMSESLRGLKAVAEVTTDFANATDGGVNAGKSFFYATNADAPGTLTVQGNKVLRKTSFDVLGAMFTVGKGAPPPSRRIQTRFEAAKNIARRARSLPIPMDQKEGYVAASATAKALYGVSVWQPAGTYMEGLRVATLAGLWTGGNRRCDAVVLNTLCRGHRLDPRVAAIHRRVNTFSQQMVKQSHLAPLVVAIRAARQARRDRPPGAPEAPGRSKEGPVFLLERAIADIGWTWPRFDTLQEGTGRRREWTVVQNVEPLTKEERQRAQTARHNFQHELREAGRTMRYKDVVKTRASLLGIEDGIDGGATRDLLEKGAITGYQQGLVRAVIANAVHTGKRWEQATCRFCDAGVPEDEQHMWWDCVKWSDVRGAYPNVLARRPEMKPCMALCGVMPKDAMGLDFDECRELAAGMQLMCVEILLGRQRADGILEQDCRRKELKVSTYPWGWEPQRPTASQTINVDGARPDRNAWKGTHEMLLALAEWCSTKRWSETGKEASISYFELAVDFELHSGLTLTPAGTQRRQENIAQRQPKERWTVADTLPGEETAAQAYSDSATAKGWAMNRAEQVGQDCARESRPPGPRDARQPPHQPRGTHPPWPQQTAADQQPGGLRSGDAGVRSRRRTARAQKDGEQRTGRPGRPLGEGGCPDRQLPTPGPLPTGVATQRREVEGTGKTRPGDAPSRTRRRQPPPLGRPSERREEESRRATGGVQTGIVNQPPDSGCSGSNSGSDIDSGDVARTHGRTRGTAPVHSPRGGRWPWNPPPG
ncbi:Retrovirus-related Pol polyprotein from type-2 retrotransposable element R2DM [Diplonema papillatum]|nr:Retrovirus-related Pol polyprotein from type-2 retrotransposable element R2DM [Diplonema papillatum]